MHSLEVLSHLHCRLVGAVIRVVCHNSCFVSIFIYQVVLINKNVTYSKVVHTGETFKNPS